MKNMKTRYFLCIGLFNGHYSFVHGAMERETGRFFAWSTQSVGQ